MQSRVYPDFISKINEHNAGACIIQYIIQWLKSVLEFLI